MEDKKQEREAVIDFIINEIGMERNMINYIKEEKNGKLERVAKAVLLATKIRAESFDYISEYQEYMIVYDMVRRRLTDKIIHDPERFYTKSWCKSAGDALKKLGLDQCFRAPLSLILTYALNDGIGWAKHILKEGQNRKVYGFKTVLINELENLIEKCASKTKI